MRATDSRGKRNIPRRLLTGGSLGLALLGLALIGLQPAVAAEHTVDADGFLPRVESLVVTGMREQPLADVPRSGVVITAEDLQLKPSVNLTDLLAREANVVLRATSGNIKFSGVDIRGQGDTYGSNVVVMLDGIRLNAEDLSGADYSVVPFNQIETIEVIRGANTVRYGSGAVGGVINIRTRPAPAGSELEARARVGSFSTVKLGADGSLANESAFISAGVTDNDTDGYRDNEFLEQEHLRGRAGYSPVDWLALTLAGSTYEDSYGLPGPASDPGSRETNTPNDGGKTMDDRLRADIVAGTDTTGVARLAGVSRDRTNDFVILDTPGAINEDSDRLDFKYEKSLRLLNREHTLIGGFVFDEADYSRRLGATGELNTEVRRGDIDHRAWFAATDIALSEGLRLSAGYRADRFELRRNDSLISEVCDDELVIGTPPNVVIICNDPGGARPEEQFTRQADTWRNDALEFGLVYTTVADTRWFVSWSKSFRNPNIDELALATEEIRPQTGRHLDAGVRTFVADELELSAAVYYVRTDDEILFALDPESGLGVNLSADEPTERHGWEADARWYATPVITLNANVGYTRARFKESRASLPLVPEWTASAGALIQPRDDLSLTVAANYVGTRFDGNDFNNETYDKVDSYTTVDAKVAYTLGDLQLYSGIANLFDEAYATSVYSNQFYPMPGRNLYAGFSYRVGSG